MPGTCISRSVRKVLRRLQVVGHDLEQVVVVARDRVALEDLRIVADLRLDLADPAELRRRAMLTLT